MIKINYVRQERVMGIFNLLDRVVRRGIFEEVIFEQQPEDNRRREVSHGTLGRGCSSAKSLRREKKRTVFA